MSGPGPVRILAVTLDLDDTLWPVLPALQRADEAVDAWLRQHHPDVAQKWPIEAMRALRLQVAAERADLAHDFTTQRQLTLQQAFAACGIADAPVQVLWDIYFAQRNTVDLYADSLPALRRIAARRPLASLTNGNADLQRVGIHVHFAHHVCARDTGVAKPDPRIFHAAADCLGVPPAQVGKRALSLAQAGIARGDDRQLPPLQRVFTYLPLEHAEDLALQDRSVALFEALRAEVGPQQRASFEGFLDYARRHREVIARFGRFPHRNAVLGRASTAEEALYLAQPGAGF